MGTIVRFGSIGNVVGKRFIVDPGHMGRTAGRFAKHVVPAAFKPVHSLWHEILGFVFMVFGFLALWRVIHNPAALGPMQMAILLIFSVVMILYGVSSFLKARRISRS